MGARTVMTQLVVGAASFIATMSVVLIVVGGLRYALSGGDQGSITAAKNTILYGWVGIVVAGVASLAFILMPIDITSSQITWGVGLGAVATALVLPLLTMRFVPMAVAVYSAWWMPETDRTPHRQDILYVLTHVHGMQRSRYAWQLLLSSPRSGLRQRRFYARLAAVAVADR